MSDDPGQISGGIPGRDRSYADNEVGGWEWSSNLTVEEMIGSTDNRVAALPLVPAAIDHELAERRSFLRFHRILTVEEMIGGTNNRVAAAAALPLAPAAMAIDHELAGRRRFLRFLFLMGVVGAIRLAFHLAPSGSDITSFITRQMFSAIRGGFTIMGESVRERVSETPKKVIRMVKIGIGSLFYLVFRGRFNPTRHLH